MFSNYDLFLSVHPKQYHFHSVSCGNAWIWVVLARLYKSTGRAIALPPSVGINVDVNIMMKFLHQSFKVHIFSKS